MALFIALTAVAVERFIKRRRLALHEVLADIGWLTLLFALIEFAYLKFVEALTLNYGAAARPLWYTEWWVFKDLLLNAAVGVFLILTSVWLEAAGIRVVLRRPQLRRVTAVTHIAAAKPTPQQQPQLGQTPQPQLKRCDIEWHEAS